MGSGRAVGVAFSAYPALPDVQARCTSIGYAALAGVDVSHQQTITRASVAGFHL
jgi:hypothetical protein